MSNWSGQMSTAGEAASSRCRPAPVVMNIGSSLMSCQPPIEPSWVTLQPWSTVPRRVTPLPLFQMMFAHMPPVVPGP